MPALLSRLSSKAIVSVAAFAKSESGIVTTDWIVLTGAIVGIGLSATIAVRTGVADLALDVESSLDGAQVAMIMERETIATPLRWTEVAYYYTAGTRCPRAPDPCPNFTPAQTWEHAMLELEDGTMVERVSVKATGTEDDPVVEWRDDTGKKIDAPKGFPELNMDHFVCDSYWDRCTLAASPSKE